MKNNLILIAEDDADIRELISLAVERAGFTAVGAKDGNTAARILAVAKPVGLITDVVMPTLNGLELCRLARQNPDLRDTAIVMISANAHAFDVDAGLVSGADRYLTKPLSPTRMVDELKTLIHGRRVS
jgi:two-component system response regulator MtrA